MTNAVRFTIPGPPAAKGRPRATTIGGHARMYTPAKTMSYESLVAWTAKQAMGPSAPILGPLSVFIGAVWSVPASWSKKRSEAAIYRAAKPDVDNVAKIVADACNGIVWGDDAQIVELRVSKRYGAVPGVTVEVAEL